ncbi:uncharacterized protein Dwil_GK25763 [Drosophila willistoni]|uniref:Bromodomain associated domain-containing protein n=1 Tax=Drosophila willistoni TaxID=7260 RepID=B4NC03_DROWI|nr:uncharacterized protein LOC6649222 [Drosophila willistoni]EDW82362.1 uncharacterized protein Dwil_GK25763 [Drosophila willistoni]
MASGNGTLQVEHWGSLRLDGDAQLTSDKYVPTTAKKSKLEEIRQQGEIQPEDTHHIVELKSSLVTQTIEVMKQTEMLQSLIDTYSNKNGTSNYLLNPCQMIPEVDFPPENAADLVGGQKFQKPIWFIPTVDTAYSRGEPQPYPEISSLVCRQTLRKVMCGMLRLAGFTDCSESAIQLLTDATEEFLRSFIGEYRETYDINPRLKKSTMLRLLPLEQAYTSVTGTSLTQVHNYYKHRVMARNRAEIAEFNCVLQEYDKLMKESQSSMSMQKHNEFNGSEYLNMLDNSTGTGSSQSMGHIVGDIMQDLSGNGNGQVQGQGQQGQMLRSTSLYGLLENSQSSTNATTSNMTNTSSSGGATTNSFQPNFES